MTLNEVVTQLLSEVDALKRRVADLEAMAKVPGAVEISQKVNQKVPKSRK